MKAVTYSILIILCGLAIKSYGQEQGGKKNPVPTEAQRQKQQYNYYRKTLQLDSVQADKVARIQDSYKASMHRLDADTTLSPEVRRLQIKQLMDVKNQQLRGLLTPDQQRKLIPVTETAPQTRDK